MASVTGTDFVSTLKRTKRDAKRGAKGLDLNFLFERRLL